MASQNAARSASAARMPRAQVAGLRAAIHSHEFLHRLLREIEELQRIVFHRTEGVDFKHTQRSAEQILTAEIYLRHHGEIDGIYFALRDMERAGTPWAAALQDLAARIHSYYTTPLGIVMRRNLFGDEAVFITPDAIEWARTAQAGPATDERGS